MFVQVAPQAIPVLTAPSGVIVGTPFEISWTSVDGAESYVLSRVVRSQHTPVYTGTNLQAVQQQDSVGSVIYSIRACNPAGCGPTSTSHEVIVRSVQEIGTAPALTVPASSHTGSYTVSWSGTNTDRHELQQRFGQGAWTLVRDAQVTTWSTTDKVAGTWHYRVRACNAASCSPYSATGSIVVTLSPVAQTTLQVPATSHSADYVVSWTHAQAATRTELEERTQGGAWVQVSDGAGLAYNATARPRGTHAYRARGCNIAGCGPFSAARSILVTLPPDAPPVVEAPAASDTGRYGVNWTSVDNATSYTLEEQIDGAGWVALVTGAVTSPDLAESQFA